jgi:hypothetical protein
MSVGRARMKMRMGIGAPEHSPSMTRPHTSWRNRLECNRTPPESRPLLESPRLPTFAEFHPPPHDDLIHVRPPMHHPSTKPQETRTRTGDPLDRRRLRIRSTSLTCHAAMSVTNPSSHHQARAYPNKQGHLRRAQATVPTQVETFQGIACAASADTSTNKPSKT